MELVCSLPVVKRQPNLLLGVIKYLYGTCADYPSFRHHVIDHWAEVSSAILARRTQTNEVARCAVLLPLLIDLPQPLALVEVGASAGLCLLLDRYQYVYGNDVVGPRRSPVKLRCELRGSGAKAPNTLPGIAWRAGLDLDPVDVRDGNATRWLEALVWPGEGDRLSRLRSAIEVARADPPQVVKGDLRTDIDRVLARAPKDATLVVFHSATLTYIPQEDRSEFAAKMARIGAVWIANEGANVLAPVREHLTDGELATHEGDFVLSRNGVPVAWTDPHGSWLQWRVGRGTSELQTA